MATEEVAAPPPPAAEGHAESLPFDWRRGAEVERRFRVEVSERLFAIEDRAAFELTATVQAYPDEAGREVGIRLTVSNPDVPAFDVGMGSGLFHGAPPEEVAVATTSANAAEVCPATGPCTLFFDVSGVAAEDVRARFLFRFAADGGRAPVEEGLITAESSL